MIARWALETQNGRIFRVIAEGVSYDQYAALRKMIADFRGHVAITRDDYDNHTGTLDVRTKLTRDAFRDCLSALTIGSCRVRIDRSYGTVTVLALE